jgi:hypothetical protein
MSNYLKRKTVSINQILSVPKKYYEVVELLKSGFKEKWSMDEFMNKNTLETYELKIANELRLTKYLTDEWNQKK